LLAALAAVLVALEIPFLLMAERFHNVAAAPAAAAAAAEELDVRLGGVQTGVCGTHVGRD
jgi:hypothetical protein